MEAPLRDRIVKDLFKKLDDKKIGSYNCDQWDKGNAHRSVWLERQQEYLSDWDEHLLSDTSGPFEGSSQLHIPVSFIVSKAFHARALQAIWQDPPFFVKANKSMWQDRVALVRDVLRYYLLKGANYKKGVGKVVDSWVWKWITQGSAVLKQRWDVTYTRFKDVRPTRKPGPPVIQVINGQEVAVPGPVIEDEEEFDNTIKCFDGPVMECVSHDDLLIIGGGGDPDLADEVHHQIFLTASELWTLADRKIFESDKVKDIIEGGKDYKGSPTDNIKQQRAQNAGQASADNEQELDRYTILESYLKVDVDGSGINADVITWTHKRSKALLRATYLYRVSRTGERPFAKADFHLREGQEYGVGIPELIYPIAKEIDAIHNMRIDFGLISVMPFGFYRASSGIDPETIKLEPGALIPVDNPQADVYFPNLGNRTVFGFQEEQALDNLIQRLTGITDLSLGMTTSQGATRTASGARGLFSEISTNLDVHLRRLNWGWEKALRYLMHSVQQRMPKGLSFRITGEDGGEIFRQDLDYKQIEGDYEIEISPNSATSNQGIQQEVASKILEVTMNPLNIQVGVVNANNHYEALKNYFQALGVKDYGRYLNKPSPTTYQMSPIEELDLLLGGARVPIDPAMDHQGFINLVEMFMKDEYLNGQFSQEQMSIAIAQSKRHEQMMAALEAQAAQAANAQQMRTNAAQSQNQAPPAMNPQQGSAPTPGNGGLTGAA